MILKQFLVSIRVPDDTSDEQCLRILRQSPRLRSDIAENVENLVEALFDFEDPYSSISVLVQE